MLKLARKIGQRIVINGNTVVTVVKIKGNRVELGVEAPREISVLREELDKPKDGA